MTRTLAGKTVCATLIALLTLAGIGTAAATTQTFTRWKYGCQDGYVEVVPANVPKTYIWEDMRLDSHSPQDFGAGYTGGTSPTGAANWCYFEMNQLAAVKCERLARMFGGHVSYWFRTTASHDRSHYMLYIGPNGGTQEIRPWTTTTLAQQSVEGSGHCSHGGPIR